MVDDGYKRKLTTILSADVVGYSRLMGDDEVVTVSALKLHRNMITEKVQSFNERVIDSQGDNILSEVEASWTPFNVPLQSREGSERKKIRCLKTVKFISESV